ncbi:uncharacterized protein PAC_04573 [Phialocephala subalpina]|uniref:Uncharacterized protein n=1 Tax=Phialocephala subalpina TaxID=576137 RepID=A0A1L7WPJ6_9HELO|nr:uncharacterized protein PAC_04573 [Phialocephala subalpina]
MPVPIFTSSHDSNGRASPSLSRISNNATNGNSTTTPHLPLTDDPMSATAPRHPVGLPILRRSTNNDSDTAADSNSDFSTEIHPALRGPEANRTRRSRSRRRVSFEPQIVYHSPESSNPSPIPSPDRNASSSPNTGTNGDVQEVGRIPFPGFDEIAAAIVTAQFSYDSARNAIESIPYSRQEDGTLTRTNVLEARDHLYQLNESLREILNIWGRERERMEERTSSPSQNRDRESSPNRTTNDDDSLWGDYPNRGEMDNVFTELRSDFNQVSSTFSRRSNTIGAANDAGLRLSDEEYRDNIDELGGTDRRLSEMQETVRSTLRLLRGRIENAGISGNADTNMPDRTRERRRSRGSERSSDPVLGDSTSNAPPPRSGPEDNLILSSERTQAPIEILVPGPRSPIVDQIRQLPGYEDTLRPRANAASTQQDNIDEAARAIREIAPGPENRRPQNPTPNRARGDESVNLDERIERLARGPPRRYNVARAVSSTVDDGTRDGPNIASQDTDSEFDFSDEAHERISRRAREFLSSRDETRDWIDLLDDEIERMARHELEQQRVAREARSNAEQTTDIVENSGEIDETTRHATSHVPDQDLPSENSSGANTSASSTGATAGSAGEASLTSSTIKAVEPSPRRQQMWRQMAADMERHSRRRERELEQDRGYSKWMPESSPERRRNRRPSPSSSFSSMPSLDGFPRSRSGGSRTRAWSPASVIGWNPPRERSPGPSVRERRRERRRADLEARNARRNNPRTTGAPFPRPADGQPDLLEDFLRRVLASNPPSATERNTTRGYFAEISTTTEQQRTTYSFASGSSLSLEIEEDFYRERAALRARQSAIESGVNVVSQLLSKATNEGLDLRDARALLFQWTSYYEESVQQYPNIPNMLPPAALAFWVALRRGWGDWRLSNGEDEDHFRRIRHLLVRLSPLSPEEQAVFEIMIEEEQTPLRRIAKLYRNWAMFAPSIDDNSRQTSEQHLSRNQLRMDRLSRLIREERVINSVWIEDGISSTASSCIPDDERFNEQRRRRTLRRTFHRPLHEVPDAGETYLRFLLTVLVGSVHHQAGTAWTGRRFDEGTPSTLWMGETTLDSWVDDYLVRNYQLRYSLADRWPDSSTNVAEEYNVQLGHLTTAVPEIEATLLRTVIRIAVADGMSIREAAGFLFYWTTLRQRDASVACTDWRE